MIHLTITGDDTEQLNQFIKFLQTSDIEIDYVLSDFSNSDGDISACTLESDNQNTVYIKDINGIHYKIPYDDILFLKSDGRTITLCTGYKSVQSNMYSLDKFQCILPVFFLRCHKQYILNAHYIYTYDKTTRMVNIAHYSLPVGRTYKTDFEQKIGANPI